MLEPPALALLCDGMTALTEGHRLGPYRIVRLLGEGGMGAVYEARQEPLDRRVALKTLRPEYAGNKDAVARFFNEAKVLSRLEHPSIVQVSDFGHADDGTAYLVMEYLRGQSLGRRLSEGERRLPVVTALQLAWQVADVLAVAHAQGVVHRDLKPDNLMLVADPVAPGGERVKVLDFGIAKLTRGVDSGGVKTDTLAVMGTPMYMSPEQCAGAGGVDHKTDVYSLGCVLYEALAGRPPYVAEGAGQIIGMHLFQTPPPLLSLAPKTPASVAELVHRLLIKDKAQRPNMSEAADDIGRILSKLSGAGSIVRSRPPASTDPDATRAFLIGASGASTLGQSIGQRTKVGSKTRRLLLAVLGTVLLTGAATVLLARRPSSPPVASAPAHQPRPVVQMESRAAVAPVEEEEKQPVLPRTVLWKLDTDPLGATVLDEKGQVLGITPWAKTNPSSAGTALLRLRLAGFSEATVTMDRSSDAIQLVKLHRIPAAPAKVASPKAPVLTKPSAPSPIPSPKRSELPYEP